MENRGGGEERTRKMRRSGENVGVVKVKCAKGMIKGIMKRGKMSVWKGIMKIRSR